MSARWDIVVRLWKEVPDFDAPLPPATQTYRLQADSLDAAVAHCKTLVDFEPKYFQATRVR